MSGEKLLGLLHHQVHPNDINESNSNRIQRRNSRLFTISSLFHELSPTHSLKWPRRYCVQIACTASSTHYLQHAVLRATWYKGTAQLLSLTEFNCIYFSFILLAEPLTDEGGGWGGGGRNRSTRRKPLATSFRKCHILQPEDSSPSESRTRTIALVAG